MEDSLGFRIRALRRDRRLTQEAVAEAIPCAPEYISRIETGRVQPSWRFLVRFAEVLHISTLDLLRAAGLVTVPAVNEDEISAIIAAYPQAAGVIEYMRLHPSIIPDTLRFVRMLVRERENDHGEPGSGDTRGNTTPGD